MLEPVVSIALPGGASNTQQSGSFTNTVHRRLVTLAVAVPVIGALGTTYPHGRAFGTVTVTRAGQPLATLWEGYITSGASPMSYPDLELVPQDIITFTVSCGSGVASGDTLQASADFIPSTPTVPSHPQNFYEPPGSGRGETVDIHASNPSAGVDLIVTVPNFAHWDIHSLRGNLTTSSTVDNRVPRWQLQGVNGHQMFNWNVISVGWLVVVAASSSQTYSITESGLLEGLATAANTGAAIAPGLPINLILQGGCVLQANTALLQSGDQWSSISYLVEEWAVPAV